MSTNNTIVKSLLAKYGINYSPINSEIGKGWEPLLENLLRALKLLDPDLKIGQIKEKFGSLRVYVDPTPTNSKENETKKYELCRQAQEDSAKVCIVCGNTGRIVQLNSWLQCFCEDCEEKVKNIRKKSNYWDLLDNLYQNGK